MKMLRLLLPAFAIVVCALLPETVSAALFGPIIDPVCHCPTSAPDWGCVLQTIQNGMNLVVSAGVLIATIVIAYAGALWILSPINPKNRELGRTVLLNAVVGLLIVLSAWVFIDFLMKALYNPNASGEGVTRLGPWEEIIAGKKGESERCIKTHPDATSPTGSGQVQAGGEGEGETTTACTGVEVFEHIDYGGKNVCLAVGDYKLPDLTSRGIANNSISSIKVGTGFRGTMYIDDNFSGSALTWTSNDPSFDDVSWNDAISSIKVLAGGGTSSGGSSVGSNADRCPGAACVELSPQIACDASGCKVARFLKEKLIPVKNRVSFAVTEGYEPSKTHCAVCHQDGRCVDVGLRPRTYTAETITAFYQAVAAAGLSADFETTAGDPLVSTLRAEGIEVHTFPGSGITARHFSVYGPWGSEGSTGGPGCSAS